MHVTTLGFRIVKGKLSGATVDGAGRVVPQLNGPVIKPTVKPVVMSPQPPLALPPAQSPGESRKGVWSLDEDNRLVQAIEAVRGGKQPFRWRDVACMVKTRDARQCSYHWMHHRNPNSESRTPKRKKDECSTGSGSKRKAKSFELKAPLDEVVDLLDDVDVESEINCGFDMALGHGLGEDGRMSPFTVDRALTEEGRKRRRLVFEQDLGDEERCDGTDSECDMQLTNSVQVDDLLKIMTDVVPPKPFAIRMVKEVTYKGTDKKAVFQIPCMASDRFEYKQKFASINKLMSLL
jgi:hypothetical protein